jgi:hypothetical protein
LRNGGAAPFELVALQAAEAWGIPPWEVWEHDDSAFWVARWSVYRDELNKAQKKK